MTEPSRQAPVTVAVDFDGVLHQRSGRFSDQVTGDPVPGAADGLRRLAERYDVVIFPARTALEPGRRWLPAHGMGGFEVTTSNYPPSSISTTTGCISQPGLTARDQAV